MSYVPLRSVPQQVRPVWHPMGPSRGVPSCHSSGLACWWVKAVGDSKPATRLPAHGVCGLRLAVATAVGSPSEVAVTVMLSKTPSPEGGMSTFTKIARLSPRLYRLARTPVSGRLLKFVSASGLVPPAFQKEVLQLPVACRSMVSGRTPVFQTVKGKATVSPP